MLGWMITVYRQPGGGRSPAGPQPALGDRVARWQGSLDALDWLRDRGADGSVIDLGGNGYPSWMTARAGAILPVIRNGPPLANEPWASGEGDVLLPGWEGRGTFETATADKCSDDEWLVVEIWDES